MRIEPILEAAAEVQKKGLKVLPRIIVQLVAYAREVKLQKEVWQKLDLKKGELKYTVETIINISRATITARKLTKYAELLSFKTSGLI